MKDTSKSYKPSHGGYPDPDGYMEPSAYDARMPGQVNVPRTTCPCGQVPVCHGLRTCGKKTA